MHITINFAIERKKLVVNNMPRLVWMDSIDSTINTVALIQIGKGFRHATLLHMVSIQKYITLCQL